MVCFITSTRQWWVASALSTGSEASASLEEFKKKFGEERMPGLNSFIRGCIFTTARHLP